MFSSKLGRVAAHRAPAAASAVLPASSSTTVTHRTTQSLSTRSCHQRRHSSSKPQAPPDSSKPAPNAKASATDDASPSSAPDQHRSRGKKAARYSRFVADRTLKGKLHTVDRFAALPAVAGVQHMHESEFGLSSFFSLHRPLSLSSTIPPPTTTEQFNSIFDSKPTRDSWDDGNSAQRRPEQVIYTLHDTIEALENAVGGSSEEAMGWETLQESSPHGGVKHLDGMPRRKTIDDIVAFRHFRVPPPPQPFTEESKAAKKRAAKEAKKAQQPKQKRYTATIMVTESTYADGQRTFTASSSPITPMPEGEDTGDAPAARSHVQQPFLRRMRKRQQLYARTRQHAIREPTTLPRPSPATSRRVKMMLISVKRQRKLKMKKHKYKKLMKRTRNLRRRQDRA